MSGTVIVVSGGGPPAPGAADDLPRGAHVIAADSGLEHARALGLDVDLVVGDMDSVHGAALGAAAAHGTAVDQHPAAKDKTDLELALDRAVARRPDRIVVLGPDAGRLDHLVGGALLLTSERYAGVAVEARLGSSTVTVVRGAAPPTELRGRPGDLITLLPVGGTARGVTTEDLLYPLADEDLAPGTTRGVSNRFVHDAARVGLRDGTLLAIQPGGEAVTESAPWT